jgi:hypothetical protein
MLFSVGNCVAIPQQCSWFYVNGTKLHIYVNGIKVARFTVPTVAHLPFVTSQRFFLFSVVSILSAAQAKW